MNSLKNRKLIYVLFFVIISVLAFYINANAYTKTVKKLSEFVFWMSVSSLVFSLITIFLRNDVASMWRKFSNYFLLLSVFIILITPNSAPGNDIYPVIKENVTIVLVTLYSVISFVLILYKSFKRES